MVAFTIAFGGPIACFQRHPKADKTKSFPGLYGFQGNLPNRAQLFCEIGVSVYMLI